MQIISTLIIPITMFGVMFSMGLTLDKGDFKRVAVYPKASVIALVIQLLIMPLVGIALALAFGLSPMLAAGLVAVAACPGGTLSNVMVHLAKADTALSITLTAVASFVTLVTLPLWINYSLSLTGTSATNIDMPILRTAAQLGVFTVLPVSLGMIAVAYKPVLSKWEPKITQVSTAAMLISFVVLVMSDADKNLDGAASVVVPSILLLLSAIVIGYGLPRAFGVAKDRSATICIEITLKNILLAIFIATNSLKSLEASYTAVAMTGLMLPCAFLVVLAYRRSARLAASI